ncbi:MAG: DUF4234 domain-containing protein [Oligoflexia bacterium]|nr:DUF4234 domain-containing protein [Oligoflexia bacterium]MBF0366148.1 DUF4234 domain-containing protein [Oligoflexia bacterium]
MTSMPTRPNTSTSNHAANQHEASIAFNIILSLLTCGLYNIIWNYREMIAVNDLLGREEFTFLSWALLTLVTCGLYHIYFEYRMARVIIELQERHGVAPEYLLPAISLTLTFFQLWIITDAIQQNEINKVCRKLSIA